MILFCPDLTCKEEVKAMTIGNGDFTRPVLHACLKSKCVAYKDGRCVKYDNEVEKDAENETTEKADGLQTINKSSGKARKIKI